MDTVKNTIKRPIATWNCRGRLVVVEKPLVMGILNVTPDSFYQGSRVEQDDVITRAEHMLAGRGGYPGYWRSKYTSRGNSPWRR